MNSIGERIKFQRKRLGLTQEQLADRMGVSPQAVSKWEHNLSCPDISALPALAGIFGITVDELLGKDAAQMPAKEGEIVDDTIEEDSGAGVNMSIQLESKHGGILFALYILLVGGLLLCRNFVPAMDVSWWTVLWTTALVFIGISGLLEHFSLFCLALAGVGVCSLLNAYGVIAVSWSWKILIPAALLLWGVSLLIDVLFGNKPWRRKKQEKKWNKVKSEKMRHEYHCTDGVVTCDMAFGSYRTKVQTALLRGGKIDSCFGDFTVDFTECEAVAPDCVIEVDNSFGELTLVIPERFVANVRHDAAFAGGPQFKGHPDDDPEGVINIKADISFGNVVIKYD